jgi:hypothetical protein
MNNQCLYCKEPLLPQTPKNKQTVKWHKKCRTKGRQALRKAIKNYKD